jgi:hypothetical protein
MMAGVGVTGHEHPVTAGLDAPRQRRHELIDRLLLQGQRRVAEPHSHRGIAEVAAKNDRVVLDVRALEHDLRVGI